LLAAAFLTRSQTKGVSAPSLVQDSGAPAWLSTAARDPGLDLLAPWLHAPSQDGKRGLLRGLAHPVAGLGWETHIERFAESSTKLTAVSKAEEKGPCPAFQ
jgi:hypothetical protein